MKVKYNDIILFCYGISIFIFAILQSTVANTFGITKILKIVLVIVSVIPFILESGFNPKINLKTLGLLSLLTLLIIANILSNDASTDLLYIIAFAFLCRKIEPEKIFRTYAISVMFAFTFVLLCWKLGLVESNVISGRNYLGFAYSTFGPNLFFHACLAFVAGTKRKIPILLWAVILLVNIWLFIKTDTMAVFAELGVLFVLYYITRNEKVQDFIFNNKITSWSISNFVYLAAGITIVFQCIYNLNYEKFSGLNELLSNRLSLARQAFSEYDVSLFGQSISWHTTLNTNSNSGEKYFYVDSSYLQILLSYGILMLVILCIFMAIMGKYSVKTRNINISIALIIFLVHCITDPQLLSFRYDPFLVAVAAAYMFVNKSNKKIENEKSEIDKIEEKS